MEPEAEKLLNVAGQPPGVHELEQVGKVPPSSFLAAVPETPGMAGSSRPRISQPAEKIVGAAVRTPEGKIFSGTVHSSAAANANDAGFKLGPNPNDVDGFLTSTGRYVSREEAAKIADAAEQMRSPQESLESGNLAYGYSKPAERNAALKMSQPVGQRLKSSYDEILNKSPKYSEHVKFGRRPPIDASLILKNSGVTPEELFAAHNSGELEGMNVANSTYSKVGGKPVVIRHPDGRERAVYYGLSFDGAK
jgi:hypothetical protein